jgi:DNA-binding response OmpR family regulator
MREFIRRMKTEKNMPSLALVPADMLDKIENLADFDDFLASPFDSRELVLRIRRLLAGSGKAETLPPIQCEGLVLDTTTCDVTVDGRKVELTFKEYELLKLLASHRGRVFTRQELLDKIWGYDYYGGDRTVDVHVRRLRSKIEFSDCVYIETVRNIGYRFAKEARADTTPA